MWNTQKHCRDSASYHSVWQPKSCEQFVGFFVRYRTTEIQIYTNKNYTGRLTVLGDSLKQYNSARELLSNANGILLNHCLSVYPTWFNLQVSATTREHTTEPLIRSSRPQWLCNQICKAFLQQVCRRCIRSSWLNQICKAFLQQVCRSCIRSS